MSDHLTTILSAQFEAALCMLDQCIRKCPENHWEDMIGNNTFRQVAYHTLHYVDLYLSPNKAEFRRRSFHRRARTEQSATAVSTGLTRAETRSYLAMCRQKALDALSLETAESLRAPSGFTHLRFSRGELHLYNLRHIQHHTGQLSAYLRRVVKDGKSWWVKTGWR